MKSLTPINNQMFIVSYIGATDTAPARIKINDTRFKKSILLSYDDDYENAHHQARAELEGRGFNINAYAYDDSTGKAYFLSRDFRSIKEPAPTAPPEAPETWSAQNIHFSAFYNGKDKNGNSLLKIKPDAEQYRAFSLQRLNISPAIQTGTKGERVTSAHALALICAYIANHGTDTQKNALKIPVFEYDIESNYNGQWERVTTDDTRQAARATLKDYRTNEPQRAHRIVKRRIGA